MIFVSPDFAACTRLEINVWTASVKINSPKTVANHAAARITSVRLFEEVKESNEINLILSVMLSPRARLNKNRLINGMSFGLINA